MEENGEERTSIWRKGMRKKGRPRKGRNVETKCGGCRMHTVIEKERKLLLWCMEYDKYCRSVAGHCKRRR